MEGEVGQAAGGDGLTDWLMLTSPASSKNKASGPKSSRCPTGEAVDSDGRSTAKGRCSLESASMTSDRRPPWLGAYTSGNRRPWRNNSAEGDDETLIRPNDGVGDTRCTSGRRHGEMWPSEEVDVGDN